MNMLAKNAATVSPGDAHLSPVPRNDTMQAVSAVPANGEESHGVTRDSAEKGSVKPTNIDLLRYAQKKSGRRPMELVREYYRLHRGPGRLTWPEYVQLGVWDLDRHSPEDQARFITNTLHWPITHACCDMTWQATTEDKWLCSHILSRSSIRVPTTLAVIDKTDRAYPKTRKISTADDLRDFMRTQDGLPVFGKENRGICSYGAFLATESDDQRVFLQGEGWLAYDTLLDRFVDDTPYLLQRAERNHSFFGRYTDGLATVRVCILVREHDIEMPFAILKMPSRGNVADSFWRPGNFACNLDVRTGRVLTVRSKDQLGTTDHESLEEGGVPLLGQKLPMWDRVLQMARDCAPIFRPVRYQSMDIAVTQDGPVLVEINTGGGFDLPQLASGQGFLTDDVRAFFRSCGYRKI